MMISLPLPTLTVKEALRACALDIQDDELSKRLIACEGHLVAAEKRYETLARAQQLFTCAVSNNVAGTVSDIDMKWFYKNRLSKLQSPPRALYNKIRASAKTCPLCNARKSSTLDHYLAQAHHPDFVLTPMNLIPACSDCNKAKLAANPTVIEEQTLHPYFDRLPTDQPWLFASVLEGKPLGVCFSVKPPEHWSKDLAKRLEWHFSKVGLADLYSTKAAAEVAEIPFLIDSEYSLGGAVGVRSYLRGQAGGRRMASPHSWTAALYHGLAESDWYVEGGFRNVKA